MADEKKPAEAKKNGKRLTAKKRDAQSVRRNLQNHSYKAKVSTAVRSFKESVGKKDLTAIKAHLDAVYGLMDKGVKTGIFKLNKAARIKSRLTKLSRSSATA